MKQLLCILFVIMLVTACQPEPEEQAMLVSLVIDGRELTFTLDEPMTVDEFLTQAGAELGELDRLTPQRFTQVIDGMRITVVRVREETECEEEEIPYERREIPNEGLAPDEQRLTQVGKNGIQEICYRLVYEDDVLRNRTQMGQPTVIEPPVEEVIFYGIDTELEPIPINGTLAYINNGNAWVMNESTTTKRRLTTTSNLDRHVLSLSVEGRYLLYTAKPVEDEAFVNELWVIDTIGGREPVKLKPTDVLYAEWVPQQQNVISYSTSEPRDLFPFWKALNNLWTMRIDPATGNAPNVRQIVAESGGGPSGWWGTVFKWSPDGEKVAWIQADGMGIVSNEGDLVRLIEYAPFRTLQPWSWRADISWSWDADLIATTVHGPPLGNEPADSSPVFDVIVTDTNGAFVAEVMSESGMWARPQFSPPVERGNSTYTTGYIAYLRARDPYSSVSGEYDLIVADRDGSNARQVFPRPEQPGIEVDSRLVSLTSREYTWSPDGRQIALIYQGDLWIVDVESLVSHRLTFDGGSSYPVWSR